MQLSVFCGFVLVLLFDGAVSQDGRQCPPGQVPCQAGDRGACVPRFEFSCGNRGCGLNKTLCGPPVEDPLNCVLGKRCPDRNGSLSSAEGDIGGNGGRNEDPNRLSRDDDDDDNPFVSRGSRDGRQDDDIGRDDDLGRVLNETTLRRLLRRSFNHSILPEINEPENRENGSFGDLPAHDGCGRRYSPCIKNALRNFILLKDLDGQCCRMIEDPQRFARRLRNITRQFVCPRGTKFCPFRFLMRGSGCIPMEKNCSAGHGNHSDDRIPPESHWTPWGSKSRKGFKYCALFKANIPDKVPCSYRSLIKWMAAKNDSVPPSGKACSPGTRFCPSTFDCRPKERGCGTEELTRWASKILCGSSHRFCVGCGVHCRLNEERCPREVNMSMGLREAALKLQPSAIRDEALRNLTKSGWAPFCLLRKILLARIIEGLQKCLSRKADCRKTGYEEHKNCISGAEFCQKLESFTRPFTTKSHRLCHLLRTNPAKFEEKIRGNWTKTLWGRDCPDGHVFCPISMGCVRKDNLSNCRADQQFCRAGLAKTPWNMNHSREAGSKFCCLFMSPAPNGSCSFRVMLNWLAQDDKSCSPFGDCCPARHTFSLSRMKCVNPDDRGDHRPGVNDTKCDDESHLFCERQHACLPKNVNCTEPTRFNFFSVSQFANRSGWAALCQARVPFSARLEYGLRKCEHFLSRPDGACRANTDCPEERQFCPRTGRCVPRGNCSRRPIDPRPPVNPPFPPTTISPLCNPSEPELRMLWAREPLKKLYAPRQEVPGLLGLSEVGEIGADLQFKRGDADWREYKGCAHGQMRVVSTESILRLSSCAHGFVAFDIISAPDGSAHGQCVNTPGSPRVRETVGMALLPKCAAGLDIAVIRNITFMREDRPSKEELVSNYVDVTSTPVNCSELRVEESLSCRISRAFRLRYKEAVKQIERRELGLVITKTDPPKRVKLKCLTPQGRLADVPPRGFFTPDMMCSIHPALNAVGRVDITVVPACKVPASQPPNVNSRERSCLAPDCSLGRKEAKLKVVIQPVNDRPIIRKTSRNNLCHFPPVPENVSDIDGKCINVSELTTPLVMDSDNRRAGLAITEAPRGHKFGVWQVKYSGGVLQDIDIAPGMVLLLKPTDCITFKANQDPFWGKNDSLDKTYFKTRAWDGSDNRTSGYHSLNASVMDSRTAFSRKTAKCVVLRKGCDKVPGSRLKRDQCGLCKKKMNERDSCVGCDGQRFSNKRKNECGKCVAPGAQPLYCSGDCLTPAYVDECGVCTNNDSEPFSKDCNGDCKGEAPVAVMSECEPSVCVGGNTGISVDLGKDICGKCGGKNECIDCNGELHGSKRLDSCELCLDPVEDAKLFNKCPKILNVDVRALTANKSTQLGVIVTGIQESIACYLEQAGGSQYLLNLVERKLGREKKSKVILSTPADMIPGEYSLKCSVDADSNKIAFKEKILVYSKPKILEVTPNETLINTETNVTLTGTGFVNTPALVCVFFLANGKSVRNLKATFVSQTTVICLLRVKSHLPAQHGRISALFNAKARKQAEAMAKRFVIYNLVPEPTKCVFSAKRNYLFIRFNKPVDCGSKKKWESCSSFFNAATLSKITEDSRCRCREGKLLVQLSSVSTLRPSQTVVVRLSSINRQRSGYTKHSSSQERPLNVEDSGNPVEFTVTLSAPLKVGLCDSFTISATTNQRATFTWSAAFNDSSSATPEQTADLQEMNDKLANVSSRQWRVRFGAHYMKIGITYNITVCAQEKFSGQEACSTVFIHRVSKTVPKIMFPISRIVISLSIRVKFRAKVQAPSCVNRNMRFMVYLWSCDDPGLDFDDESPNLRIGADQLTGGQILKCTFTAYVRDDDSIRASETLTIVLKKTALIAKIKGGEQRTISAHEEAVCNGRDSNDPNNQRGDPIYLWTCKCKHHDSWKSCLFRNKTSGRLNQLILPRESVVRIPAGTFPAEKTCAVTLRYFKGDMNASTSVYFDVKEQELPSVTIIRAFSTDTKIKFIAVVKSTLPDLNTEWSCKQKDEEGNLLDFDLESKALTRITLVVKKRRDKLAIKRRVALVIKQLDDGLKLKCRFNVSRGDVVAFAEDELKDEEPPIEGICREVEKSEDGRISIEADDFYDPDGEALEYRCGYITKEGKPNYITSWSTSRTFVNLFLPAGDPDNGHKLKCIVQARNTRGVAARSICPVVVLPQDFSDEDMRNATDEISEKLNQNKIAECRAMVENIMGGSGNKSVKEELLKETTKGAADEVKKMAENDDKKKGDNEDKGNLMDVLNVGLNGVKNESEDAGKAQKQGLEEARKRGDAVENKPGLAKNLNKVIKPWRRQSDGLTRRKRRAADGDNSGDEEEEVEAKTKDEVETILSVFSALIQPSNFSNSSMAVKQELVALVDNLARGLCQSLSTGEPALVAESHVVIIRSEKNSFDNVDTNFSNVACENCSFAVQTSAQVLLGESLKDLYGTWDCDEDGCNGACVVSAQYPDDLLAAFDNDSSVSDVVYAKLFNPENAAPLPASGLSEHATFRIPLRNYNASDDAVPMCHTWDESSLSWKMDGVSTTLIPDSGNGDTSVDCRSPNLGFMAVFTVDSSALPPQTTTQSPPTVSTGQVTPDEQLYIQFTLKGNYGDSITESNKPEFITKVTQTIAEAMGVTTSRVSNVDARPGSIIVSFILLPGGNGQNNVSTAASTLMELVTSGNFSVTLADGRTLVADAASFQFSATPFTTSTSQTPAASAGPTEISSKLSTGALVGIIVGSILAVVLLIVVVILIVKMRSRMSKVDYNSPKDDKPTSSPTSAPANDNKVAHGEIREERKETIEFPLVDLREEQRKESNEFPLVDLREEPEVPSLPGTPSQSEVKLDEH